MAEDHLYARLGVSEDATQEEIKRAYHKLILKVKVLDSLIHFLI